MKKLTSVLLPFCFFLAIGTVNAQPPHAKAYGHHKFYYYPERNVYYDPNASTYYYNSGNTWSATASLPSGFSISVGSPRVAVYHNSPEVWYDNSTHVRQYRDNDKWRRKHWKHDKW
jgi:hypothetical protein